MKRLTLTKSPVATDHDGAYRRAWGFTPAEWSALTNAQRAHYRDYVTSAPLFAGAFK